MTKRKFYIIKTLVAIGLAVFIYFFKYLLDKGITFGQKPSEPGFGILLFSALVSGIIFIIGMEFLTNYKRTKLPEEVEEEKRKEKEDNKRYELEQKELLEKAKQRNRELLPVVEITLFTNEKIKGQFLEKSEYLEDLETSTKYYKAYIVKIEKI
ncbi:hypothetical protein [Capnocytophaga gingivalis]